MSFDLGNDISFKEFKERVLNDYRIAITSRYCSYLGRDEVLKGKAKFGIFGDGKELPQVVLAHFYKKGDWRSGYYRDQTMMMALGMMDAENLFAGLYADTDPEHEPFAAGRQMGGHFASQSLKDGVWLDQTAQYNCSVDVSCTAGQMPRMVGLGFASKLFRNVDSLKKGFERFSKQGDEIVWGTIGNASTSEGHFFEAINAAGVLQIPMIINVWDDGYGISVPNKDHTTKGSISKVLQGFKPEANLKGVEIITVKGWDYAALFKAYAKAEKLARENHIPVLVHVVELTQPQGHSTSGSHERYKTEERLSWEEQKDCNLQFRNWILNFERPTKDDRILRLVADESELVAMEQAARLSVNQAMKNAFSKYLRPIKKLQKQAIYLLEKSAAKSSHQHFIRRLANRLDEVASPRKKDVYSAVRQALSYLRNDRSPLALPLKKWLQKHNENAAATYNSKLYAKEDLNQHDIPPVFSKDSPWVDGRIIIRDNFDRQLKKHANLFIFGEDVGKIGGVNQGMEGLQERFGADRVFDTSIRELTIIGQGIGMALRGLRPIAEIQYLDYLLYALQTLSDDVACLHYRCNGIQVAPLIVKTRGHRLEGIWHSGSPMGMILSTLHGMYVLVPRNMTQAAGFYNLLLNQQTHNPTLIIECLNGYREKEKCPDNLGEYTTPLGVVECMREGKDITIVSYGATLKIVMKSVPLMQHVGIEPEVIDIQSLMPFDIHSDIVKSVAKTGRLLVVDEDVPGGASAYILQKVLEDQNAYRCLDSAPQTLTAKPHRPAYGTDGDYFSKPSVEDVFEKVYAIFHEYNPQDFPKLDF